MAHSVPLGRRNLFEDGRRFSLAMLGIGSGLLMVLLMNGVFAGFSRQETAYLDHLPSDVLISAPGVRTMQMTISAVPDGIIERARSVPGVASVEPLRQMTTALAVGDTHLISYLFGFDTAGTQGRPQSLLSGSAPGSGEVVLDKAGADQLGVGVGGQVGVFGKALRVSGLTEGLTSVASTAAFVTAEQFTAIVGPGTNYLLVKTAPGADPDRVRSLIADQVPGVTVQTRAAFAAEEAAFVQDLYADVIHTMIGIGFVIALALVALSLSALTASKLREYGVVKALGATRVHLIRAVASQALLSVVVATALATAIAILLGMAINASVPNIVVIIEPGAVLTTMLGALIIGAPGALLPLRRVFRLDPASAFSRNV